MKRMNEKQLVLSMCCGCALALFVIGCPHQGNEDENLEDGSIDRGDAGDDAACGDRGTHSQLVDDECECEPGYEWVDEADARSVRCQLANHECERECEGRECGFDQRCEVSCGECDDGEECSDDGVCIVACDAACDDRECGPDPECGQSCGECEAGDCTEDGECSTLGVTCDPLTQQPCVSDESCILDNDLDPVCIKAGNGREGDRCEYLDDCRRGLHCIGTDAGGEYVARCFSFCDVEHPFESCGHGASSMCGWEIAGIGLCTLPCDPFETDCDAGAVCIDSYIDGALGFTCYSVPGSDTVGLGEDCGGDSRICEPGLICLGASPDSLCYRICDPEHDCGGGECQTFYDEYGDPLGEHGFCEECFPECGDRECGTDPVCGESCGSCGGGDECIDGECCTPACGDRECGTESACGTSCGSCSGGDVCTSEGECCEPDCSGRECGPDPVCGTSCGSCSGGDDCNAVGQCVCEPDCSGRECGLDPSCGTSCGICDAGDLCQSGSCCTPNCSGRECGLDPTCGTSCGSCGGDEFCEGGTCESCVPFLGWCSTTSECCEVAGADIECQYGSCQQCAGSGYDCSSVGCCSGLHCNPASICNDRDCSELGMACWVDSDCCDTAICDGDADWSCQSCRGLYTACTWDDQCCAGFECDDGMCQ